jgi:hypothetical protein
VASHDLIRHQLDQLRARLPADVVEELTDGLTETYEGHLARGLDPAAAADAAVAEFGDQAQITAAFVQQAPGRRVARTLLATGPVLAACWGPTLGMGHAWSWPLARGAGVVFGLALLATVATLVVAATSRHSYRRTRLAVPAAGALVLLDVAVLGVVLAVLPVAAPAPVWPMGIAVTASLARIWLTVRSLRRMLAT